MKSLKDNNRIFWFSLLEYYLLRWLSVKVGRSCLLLVCECSGNYYENRAVWQLLLNRTTLMPCADELILFYAYFILPRLV
jgi:hypothetical protein